MTFSFEGLYNNYLGWGGGGWGWEMGKIRLKIKLQRPHPPILTKQKLTLTSPHLLIILGQPPPLPFFLPPSNLRVGCLPHDQAQKVLQMTIEIY